MRFYVEIGVNLGFQFIIGLLITHWVCGFRWIILPKWVPLKKKKKKSSQMVGSVGSHTILCDSTQSYIRSYHFCDPVTILNFWWGHTILRSRSWFWQSCFHPSCMFIMHVHISEISWMSPWMIGYTSDLCFVYPRRYYSSDHLPQPFHLQPTHGTLSLTHSLLFIRPRTNQYPKPRPKAQ